MNILGGEKLKVYFYASYLYFSELIGYVDLSDFDENWPQYLSDINPPKFVRL